MEFFGKSSSGSSGGGSSAGGDFSDYASSRVRSATDAALQYPDWGAVMELCDHINGSPDGGDIVQAALTRRLREANHNTVTLSLSLAEACMKNCRKFAVATKKPFMDEMVLIARGSKGVKNQAESLRLIKQWDGLVTKRGDNNPLFHDTYVLLKSRGAVFPIGPSDDGAPDSVDGTAVRRETAMMKLRADLREVVDKVRLCRDMLPAPGSGPERDDALLDVLGFLEACSTRMHELIEAGTVGLLDEDLLEVCLKVNDALHKTLDAERRNETLKSNEDLDVIFAPTVTDASAAATPAFVIDDGESPVAAASSAAQGEKKIAPLPAPRGFNPSAARPAAPAAAAVTTTTSAPATTTAPSQELLDIFTTPAPAATSGADTPAAVPPPIPPAVGVSIDDILNTPTPSTTSTNTTNDAAAASQKTMSDADFDALLQSLSPSK